jgi:coenzyme F420 hydrogenase subunit beta
MPRKLQNISEAVNEDMCTGCGFCAGLCPRHAIKMVWKNDFLVPQTVANDCTNCGVCVDVCPSKNSDAVQGAESPGDTVLYDPLLGGYLKAYVGNATDPALKHRASSGGVITALLSYMLDRKLVDGVIVVSSNPKNPLNAMAIIAKTKEEVLYASGSKYTPVSMHQVIRQIMSNKNKKFAFVGLPCHLQALNKAQRKYSKLKTSIVLKIGLYCYSTPSLDATRYVLDALKIRKEQILAIRYRGNGWPGYLTIKLKNGQIQLPFTKYSDSGFSEYFCKKRCILCSDQTAECADLSFADPWTLSSKELNLASEGSLGKSVILVRSGAGQAILNEAANARFLAITPLNPKKTVQQTTALKKSNKNSASARFLLGTKSELNQNYSMPLNLRSTIWLLGYRFNSYLAKNQKRWPLLRASVAISAVCGSLILFIRKRSVNSQKAS